jgi:hypothetical protein
LAALAQLPPTPAPKTFNWAVRAMGAVLQTNKPNGALWLKRLPCSRYTEMAIKMLFLTPGSDLFFSFASQDSYGEKRYLVQKWLPVIFKRLLLKPGRYW